MKGGFCMYDQTLKAIVTAARLGSFSKAAEELYLSPTAVMKQVNQFEARHKLRLFENRTGHHADAFGRDRLCCRIGDHGPRRAGFD